MKIRPRSSGRFSQYVVEKVCELKDRRQ